MGIAYKTYFCIVVFTINLSFLRWVKNKLFFGNVNISFTFVNIMYFKNKFDILPYLLLSLTSIS
jgi:hypothetical protein